ncbi:MAG: cation:dicarboxylate symporter family transporter, partial [Hyphomicrobiales bacterium]
AVVFFCVILGVAVMQVERKDNVIGILDNLLAAITKVASYIVKLAPLGIFAIAAEASGSIEIEQFGRLKIYFLTLGLAWALMYFAVLPVILSAATPINYWTVIRSTQVAALTAFATNSTLVVLPLMIQACKELVEEHELAGNETNGSVDVLIPAAYSLPNAGALLNLSFILFAAWFVGAPLEGAQNFTFVAAGGLYSVAGMIVAGPMLLDLFQLPVDLFQLYILAGVFTTRFSTALGVMFGMVLCLLVAFSIAGKFNRRRMMLATSISVAASVITLAVFGYVLGGVSAVPFEGENRYRTATLMMAPVAVKSVELPAPLSAEEAGRPRIELIRERGTLRVGYRKHALPYSFVNGSGEIVGFDVELVHALARDLGVTIEFIEIGAEETGSSILGGRLDLITGGIAITTERAVRAAFSNSYFDEAIGFVVRDHRRTEFADVDDIRKMKPLTVAVPRRYRLPIINHVLPDANFVPIDSPRGFLEGKFPEMDALLFGARTAFAWTLSYPDYSVTIPRGMHMEAPMAFLLPPDAPRLANFINTWLTLNKEHGLIKLAHDHWILGAGLKDKKPRWSIIRDVLHWVD